MHIFQRNLAKTYLKQSQAADIKIKLILRAYNEL